MKSPTGFFRFKFFDISQNWFSYKFVIPFFQICSMEDRILVLKYFTSIFSSSFVITLNLPAKMVSTWIESSSSIALFTFCWNKVKASSKNAERSICFKFVMMLDRMQFRMPIARHPKRALEMNYQHQQTNFLFVDNQLRFYYVHSKDGLKKFLVFSSLKLLL